ncbi:hypothetical protein [Janibacter hoylei]|uniref:hypothetical protein n=1 Tax=Janibacter hoylei TaxID=364298 RepID=UPI0021A82D01|nr:hypothetical protein [Janibacter hoylei]MCT1618035.1 hypothetical protein [Janibacter hoylei]MCT2291704.1 hypothetical protein [Janibacter hoylei]
MAVNEELRLGLQVVREVQAAAGSVGDRVMSSEPVLELASPVTLVEKAEASPVMVGEPVEPPTAFVSWAHSHATWTRERTRDWESQVAAFPALLRRLGIRAEVDLFHLDEPIDWTRYGPQQVQSAKYTLIVMSNAWAERWSGTNSPREGAGAAAEADTLKGLFAQDQEAWQRRVVIVMFPDVDSSVVPPDLQRVSRVSVDPSDPDSFEPLIRMLTEQPRYPKPPVGEVPVFDSAAGYEASSSLATLRSRLDEIAKRKKQIAKRTTQAANDEREKLELSEAATRGFIDAELTIED